MWSASIATRILTTSLDAGEWQTLRCDHLSTEVTRSVPQRHSGRFGEEKNLLSLWEIEPQVFDRPLHSLNITKPTELS